MIEKPWSVRATDSRPPRNLAELSEILDYFFSELRLGRMSAFEITQKLNAFVTRHRPFTEECHVVYVMVEIRKIIDHYDLDVPLVSYYANWALHTEKSRDLRAIIPITTNLYAALVDRLHFPDKSVHAMNSVLSGFCKMHVLKAQITLLFMKFSIDKSLVSNDELWMAFVRLLSAVLADQPIIDPCGKTENLAELRFLKPGAIEFIFKQAINGHESFRYASD